MTSRRRAWSDPPWYRVVDERFRACFVVGLEQDVDAVCDVDVEVVLPDESRWTATFVTVAEVDRLMGRRAYFWCPDAVVVRDAGVDGMVGVLAGLVGTDDFAEIFRRLHT